jgi:hypothetical protein
VVGHPGKNRQQEILFKPRARLERKIFGQLGSTPNENGLKKQDCGKKVLKESPAPSFSLTKMRQSNFVLN